MFKYALNLILLMLFGNLLTAQSRYNISGNITNGNGQPVPFAHIVIDDYLKSSSADVDGNFAINGLTEGKHSITISSIGFLKLTENITISPISLNSFTFNLTPTATDLNTVEVFGEREKQPEKLEVLTRLPLKPSEQIQSISVISDQLIEKQGNLTISEAARNVPGIYTFATYGNVRESMSARGFRGIPIVKNGVRINSDFRGVGVLTDMQGVESIQVLKGSAAITQGIATDLGSPGGVINIVTKTPKFYDGGEVSLRLGSFDQIRPAFDIYGPVNESKTIAFRINGAYEHSGSYRKSVSGERIYINPSLEFRPNEKTSIVLEMDYLDDSRTPDPGTINMAGNDSNAIYDLPYDKFLGFEENRSSTINATYAVRLSREINKRLRFRAALFASSLEADQFSTGLSSGGGKGTALPSLAEYNRRYRTIGQSSRIDNNSVLQVDLIGQDYVTGKMKHTFQVGMDYRNTYLETGGASMGNLEYVDVVDVFEPISNSLPKMGKIYIPAVKDQNGNIITPARTEDAAIDLVDNPIVSSQNKSFGLMAQDVIDINSWTRVFMGVRMSTNESSGSASHAVIKGQVFDPQLGLMLKPLHNVNVFGSYTSSTSLRGADNLDIHGNELGNQRIDQVEAGFKSEWMEKRLRFNLTLYKINNKNMSIPVYDANWIQTGFYEKGGNDERKGVEVELIGRPTFNLELVVGYAYIDAQYKEHASYFKNSAPLNTPSHTANAWANYSFHTGTLSGLQIGAGAYYIGERPVNDWALAVTHEGIVAGQKPFNIEDYLVVNAQVAYSYKRYSIRVLFNNILDEIGYNAYRTRFINQTDPRNFAVVLHYKFK